MERKPALVTATALTIATSAAVSGLFLTIGNSAGAAAVPETQTITEYVVAEGATPLAAPIEVVAQPVAPDDDDPFAEFDEYFDDDSDESGDESDESNESGDDSGDSGDDSGDDD